MKRKKVSFKKSKKLFSKTAANEAVRSINSRPAPMRGGFRL